MARLPRKRKPLKLDLDEGRLHRRLRIPQDWRIPVSVCRKILNTPTGQKVTLKIRDRKINIRVTAHDHRMANFCIVAKTKWRK